MLDLKIMGETRLLAARESNQVTHSLSLQETRRRFNATLSDDAIAKAIVGEDN